MKIAVTGGNGRIGRAVVKHALADGHEVVVIDRVPPDADADAPPFFEVDTTDYSALTQTLRGCDALVHLAAVVAPGRFKDHIVHNNNVVSSYNALRAAVAVGIERVCQASSINAIGGLYSRRPRYDYFPLDEAHPTYTEDPYSLSKWICEIQADSIARRYPDISIASLRIHGATPDRDTFARRQKNSDQTAKHLWGYVRLDAVARACLLSISADFTGHERFYIVAPDTTSDTPSRELRDAYYPEVTVTGDLSGHAGFFNCAKAERLLGWVH